MEKKKGKGTKAQDKKGKGKKSLNKKKEITSQKPKKSDLEGETKKEKSIKGSTEIAALKDISIEKDKGRIDKKKIEGERIIEKEVKGDAVGLEEETAVSEESLEEHLSFFLGDEEYAIDITIIKEIIVMMDITFVPRADDYIRGVISLRGAIIPIFDLRRRLGLKETPMSNKNRIIVISIDDEMIGIAVDGVAEVVKIRGLDVEPTPFTISGIDTEYIRGICRYKGRIVILLDIVRLLKLQDSKNLG